MLLILFILIPLPLFANPIDVVQFGDSTGFWLNADARTWKVSNGKDTLTIQVSDQHGIHPKWRNAIFSSNLEKAREFGYLRTLPVGKKCMIQFGDDPWKDVQPIVLQSPQLVDPAAFVNSSNQKQEFRFRLDFGQAYPLSMVQASVSTENGQQCATTCAMDSLHLLCHASCDDQPGTQPSFVIQPTFLLHGKWPVLRFQPIQWDREPEPQIEVSFDSVGTWIVDTKNQFSKRVKIDSLRISLLEEFTDSTILDTVFRGIGKASWRIEASRLPWDSSATWKATWYSGNKQISSEFPNWNQTFPKDMLPRIKALEFLPLQKIRIAIAIDQQFSQQVGLKAVLLGDSVFTQKDSLTTILPYSTSNRRMDLCFKLASNQKLCRSIDIEEPEWKKAEISSLAASEGITTVQLHWKLQDTSLIPWISEYHLVDQCPKAEAKILQQLSKHTTSLSWNRTEETQCLKIIPQQRQGRQGFCATYASILPRSMFHHEKPGTVTVNRLLTNKRWEQRLVWTPNEKVNEIEVLWMDSSHNALASYRWEKSMGLSHPLGINTQEGHNYLLRISGIINEKEGPADTILFRHPLTSLVPTEISRIEFPKDSVRIFWTFPLSMSQDILGYVVSLNQKPFAKISNTTLSSFSFPRPPDGVYSLEIQPLPRYLGKSPEGIPRSLVISRIPSLVSCPNEKPISDKNKLAESLDHAWRYLVDTLGLVAPLGTPDLCPERADDQQNPSSAIVISRNAKLINSQDLWGNIRGNQFGYLIAINPKAPDSSISDIAVHEMAHAFFLSYRPHQTQMIRWEEALATWLQWRIGLKGAYNQPNPNQIKDLAPFEQISPQQSYPYWIRFKDKSDGEMRRIISGKDSP